MNFIFQGSSYDLSIKVSDPLNATDTKSITILVTDENRFNPELQAPTSLIRIREDETVDNIIITIKATDQDEGVNGEIEYNIIKGDPNAMFKIDKSTGSISVAKQLDYEQIPVYNIVIQAQDHGFYPRSATSSVKIILVLIYTYNVIFHPLRLFRPLCLIF